MGSTVEYSLAHIAAMTGLRPRTVQVWAEAGAIRPERETNRKGTGMHRRFSFDEAIIACVLAPLSKLKMSIGTLIQVAGNVRSNMGTLLPRFSEVMNSNTAHVLKIRFFSLEEDEGGITCAIRAPNEPSEALQNDEVSLEIPLNSVLSGLRRLK